MTRQRRKSGGEAANLSSQSSLSADLVRAICQCNAFGMPNLTLQSEQNGHGWVEVQADHTDSRCTTLAELAG